MKLRYLLIVLTACLCFAMVGCKPKEHRCVLSGTVTSDGEPVPVGNIQFIPQDPDPTKGVVGGAAEIVDGHYELAPEQGLLAGKYKVRGISNLMRDKKTGEIVDPYDVKDGKVDPLSVENVDLVPPKFGTKSEQYVEVGNEKTMTYDIAMVKE